MDTLPRPVRDGFRPDLVPGWARIAAWAIPVLTLPSVIWRLAMSIDAQINNDNPCMDTSTASPVEQVYVTALLPTVQLGLALLALGLIQRWGVVFPRWLPIVGARRVPIGFGAVAATAGAFGIVALVVWSQVIQGGQPTGPLAEGCEQPTWDVVRWYLPMALWPPLLLALVGHYVRRRRAEGS